MWLFLNEGQLVKEENYARCEDCLYRGQTDLTVYLPVDLRGLFCPPFV
jgi:hypothetical protein